MQAMQAFVNSETMVTYGTTGNMHVWDCSAMSLSDSGARETLELEHPPIFTATSSNGRLLATVSANSHTVVRDPTTLAIMYEMPRRLGSRVRSASFSGDCKLLAVVLQDSSITIWDITRNAIMWQPQGRGMMAAVDAHHVGVNGCFLSEVSKSQSTSPSASPANLLYLNFINDYSLVCCTSYGCAFRMNRYTGC
jgi:WD40 repeat protein